MIAFHSNQFKSNPICGNQDSNCGHTSRSVQVKRYIWQVSLFLKIAINSNFYVRPFTFYIYAFQAENKKNYMKAHYL